MRYRLLKDAIDYTGEQLRSHYALDSLGLPGDSIVGFVGKCDVKLKEMVDLEDLKAGKSIFSESMLHFIVEHFDTNLENAILKQHLLISIIKDLLNENVKGGGFKKDGTDIYDGEAKVTISVATLSPVSTLIHAGINVSSTNTPVKTKGLTDYKIDPLEFANQVLDRYSKEIDKVQVAKCKIKWVD